MSRGQLWSSDFAMSLMIFAVASIIAVTLIVNTLQEDEYDDVARQARTAADLISGPGYPEYWTNASVIRVGLRSDEHLSLRKAEELSTLDEKQLRKALRMDDNVFIYITNQSNDTVAVFGKCGVGMLSVASVPNNVTLPAAALATGAHPTADALGITAMDPQGAIEDIPRFDVMVLEGNQSSGVAADPLVVAFEEMTLRGISVVVIGDPGLPVFDITVNESPATAITIQGGTGEKLGFEQDDIVSVAGTIPTIEDPNTSAVTAFTKVGVTDAGKTAYATWIYNDARIWYIASPQGTRTNGQTVASTIGQGIGTMINVSRPACDDPVLPPTEQVAVHRRTLAYHEQLLTLNIIAWRSG